MDFVRFNNVVPSKTPRRSAKDMEEGTEKDEVETNMAESVHLIYSTKSRHKE